MEHRNAFGVVGCILLLTLFVATSAIAAAPDFSLRPGTIGHALLQPDGTHVYLDAELVSKIRFRQDTNYFAIQEFFSGRKTLVVFCPVPAELRHGQVIDVEGAIATLWNGERAIINPTVYGYLDKENGNLLYHGPLLKGLLQPTPWNWKRILSSPSVSNSFASGTTSILSEQSGEPNTLLSGSTYCATIAEARAQHSPTERILVELQCRPLENPVSGRFTLREDSSSDTITVYYTKSVQETDRINKIVGAIQKDAGTNYWIEVDSGPNWQPQDVKGSVQAATAGTIAWLKTLPDEALLESILENKVVSRVFSAQGYCYVQERQDQGAKTPIGIRLNYTWDLVPGDVVSIEPDLWLTRITTEDGERVIADPSLVTVTTSVDPLKPLGLNQRVMGGGSFNVFTPGPSGGSGVNNVGMLVRALGKVTSTGSDFFYLNDGANMTDGTGATGVRVTDVSGYMPAVDDYVVVTGISGLATYATDYARTIRLAGASDISAICPTFPPSDLMAVTTGSGKITLYWNGIAGATGYNVYRGTTSGGENYTTPINGGTPITTESYSGSGIYTFTNTGLTNGTEYFYTVKAIAFCGESQPSNESSDVPASDGIPWDTGDPAQILPAFRSAFSDVTIPASTLRVCGPDGRIYADGYSTWQVPDGAIDSETGEVTLTIDGSVTQLPGDGQVYGSGIQLLTTLPNAKTGPYRKVRTRSGYSYRGVKGRITLPDSSLISVTPYTYPGTNVSTKDVPYVYYGGTSGGNELDAGIYWHNDTEKFRLFMNINGQWVNMPPNGVFDSGQDVTMHFSVSNSKNNAVQVTVSNGSYSRTLGAAARGFPKSASGVRVKRCHSIAQSLRGVDQTRGYRTTGSEFLDTEWHDGVVQNTNSTFSRWGTAQTTSSDEGSFPAKGSIVNWTILNPFTQFPYEAEIGININL